MKLVGPILAATGCAVLMWAASMDDDHDAGAPDLASLWNGLSPLAYPAAAPKGPSTGNSRAPDGLIAEETGDEDDIERFWGAAECDSDQTPRSLSGPRLVPEGGDPSLTADGRRQGNSAYWEIVTHNGDRFYGERCELGRNDYREQPNTAFYREGDRLRTYVSIYLPDDFPLDTQNAFQGVLQMKQTQPSDVGDEAPPIALGAYQGRWQLFHSDREPDGATERNSILWSPPAETGRWTRFVFDTLYSDDSNKGRLQVLADLNGDGDFNDEDERSSVFGDDEPFATLRTEVPEKSPEPDDDGLAPGDSVPSHLRAGLYHSPDIECPARGCRVGIDNVQVMRARD